jgi:ribosomal protein S12 methylthiotransferase accessory factor
MEIPVTFGEGRVVDAVVGDHTIRTDQPVKNGGGDTAPAPSDLFYASIAACAGYYVLDFCLERKIPTDDISVMMKTHKDERTKTMTLIELEIKLPPEFPDKYEKAVVRAVDLCWVKKCIQNAPAFETYTVR